MAHPTPSTNARALLQKEGLSISAAQAPDTTGRLHMHLELKAADAVRGLNTYSDLSYVTQTITAGIVGKSAQRGGHIVSGRGPLSSAQADLVLLDYHYFTKASDPSMTEPDLRKAIEHTTGSKPEQALAVASIRSVAARAHMEPQLLQVFYTGFSVAAAKHEVKLALAANFSPAAICSQFRPSVDVLSLFEVMNTAQALDQGYVNSTNAVFIYGGGFSNRERALLLLMHGGMKPVRSDHDAGLADVTADDLPELEAVDPAMLSESADFPVPGGEVTTSMVTKTTAEDELPSNWLDEKSIRNLYGLDETEKLKVIDHVSPATTTSLKVKSGEDAVRNARHRVDSVTSSTRFIIVVDRLGPNAQTVVNPADAAQYKANIIAASNGLPFTPSEILTTIQRYALVMNCPDQLHNAHELLAHHNLPHSTGMLNHLARRLSAEVTVGSMLTDRAIDPSCVVTAPTTRPEGPWVDPPHTWYRALTVAGAIHGSTIGLMQFLTPGLGSKRTPGSACEAYWSATPLSLVEAGLKLTLPNVTLFTGNTPARQLRGTFASAIDTRPDASAFSLVPPEPFARFELLSLLPGFALPAPIDTFSMSTDGSAVLLSGRLPMAGILQYWYVRLTPAQRASLVFIPHVKRAGGNLEVLRIGGIQTEADWVTTASVRGLSVNALRGTRYCAIWNPRGEGTFPITALPSTSPRGAPLYYRLTPHRLRNTRSSAQIAATAIAQLRLIVRELTPQIERYVPVRLHLGNDATPVIEADALPDDEFEGVDPAVNALFATAFAPAPPAASATLAMAPAPFGAATPGTRPPGSGALPPPPGGAGGPPGGASARVPPPPQGGAASGAPLVAAGPLAGADTPAEAVTE